MRPGSPRTRRQSSSASGAATRRRRRRSRPSTACAAFDDLDELIAAVDAVAFSVPPNVQAELALPAAEAGRALLLEKPLALSVEAAERLVDAVRRADGRLLHLPARSGARRLVPRGGRRPRAGTAAACSISTSIFERGNPFGRVALAARAGRALGRRAARALGAAARAGRGRAGRGRARAARRGAPGARARLRRRQQRGAQPDLAGRGQRGRLLGR